MKKQMKIAAVVSATALLAIGASFTSMAAAKTGTWAQEDGVWYCYDKDGDLYENEFCLDGSQEFYVGDDGAIVYNSWIEYDGATYYINSEGKPAKGVWKYVVPQDDEDADAEWFWLQTSGKLAKSKKMVIEGETYFFDAEGSVLYGWVDPDNFTEASSVTGGTIFCDDETGARVSKEWVNTTEPGADDDEEDAYDYYIKSNSQAQIGKAKNISGETFFFGADGKMLDGWIIATGANADVYEEIDGENQTLTLSAYADTDIYFGCTVDGHAKKNKWIYEWKNTEMNAADVDNDECHFWVEKDGTVYVPNVASMSDAYKMTFEDAENNELTKATSTTKVAVKNIGDKYYAFNVNGEMITGMYMIDNKVYRFDGTSGARVTGSVNVTDDYGVEGKLLFSTASADKGAGVTGAKNGKLYENGLLITARDAKYAVETVDGKTYIVNRNGSIQTTKKIYKDGDEEICNAENATFETSGSTKGAVSNLQ